MRLSADSPTRPLKSSLSYRSRIPRSSAATMINVYRPSHVDLPSWIPLQSVSFSWQKEGHPMKLQVSSGKTQRLQGSSYSFGSSSDKEYNVVQIYSVKGLWKSNLWGLWAGSRNSRTHRSGMQFAFQFWVAIGFHPQPGQQIEVLHSTLKISSAPQKQYSMFIALCCWQLSKRRNAIIFWVVWLGNWRFRRFAVVDLVLDSTYRLGSSGGSLMPDPLVIIIMDSCILYFCRCVTYWTL